MTANNHQTNVILESDIVAFVLPIDEQNKIFIEDLIFDSIFEGCFYSNAIKVWNGQNIITTETYI